jgi:triosephosphate isomerase
MKKLLLGTSWKMNKTMTDGLSYTEDLVKIIKNYPELNIFLVPPYTHLWKLKECITSKKSNLMLGAQNMHYEESGQFTGEISPVMLEEIGIDIVEIGHSERREYFNETDDAVNLKALAALKHNLTPLICIGESLSAKENGISKEILSLQLKIALKNVPLDAIGKFWIAYEPIWAIGVNGIPANPTHVDTIHTYLRSILIELYGNSGKEIPLLFGGSVNINNAKKFAALENVDGLFIGRSGWDLTLFEEIMVSLSEK